MRSLGLRCWHMLACFVCYNESTVHCSAPKETGLGLACAGGFGESNPYVHHLETVGPVGSLEGWKSSSHNIYHIARVAECLPECWMRSFKLIPKYPQNSIWLNGCQVGTCGCGTREINMHSQETISFNKSCATCPAILVIPLISHCPRRPPRSFPTTAAAPAKHGA